MSCGASYLYLSRIGKTLFLIPIEGINISMFWPSASILPCLLESGKSAQPIILQEDCCHATLFSSFSLLVVLDVFGLVDLRLSSYL